MSVTIHEGNIFTTQCQTIVNTVNCVGVMGAGIALECKLRYPGMYEQYASLCGKGMITVGTLWIYKSPDRWILNFPTKKHWKDPSQEEYLHLGLNKFMSTYEEKAIKSIAFPLLGAQHGGLNKATVQDIMESYLSKCSIPVEIYQYNPMSPDDLFARFRTLMTGMNVEQIREATGLRSNHVQRVLEALGDPGICQLNQLARVDGIGFKTLEKAFSFARERILSRTQSGQSTPAL